jgi:hypothetical protein
LPGHRETAASLSVRIAIQPDRVGQGDAPQIPHICDCGRTSRAQISHNRRPDRSRGRVPQKPHSWRLVRLAISPERRFLLGFSIPVHGRSGEKRFAQILHSCVCPEGHWANYATIPAACKRAATRSGFPKNLIVGASSTPGSDASPGFPVLRRRPASEQGRGVGSPNPSYLSLSAGRETAVAASPDFS